MFNFKKQGRKVQSITEKDLLRNELDVFRILKNRDGYQADIGDEIVQGKNLSEIKNFINQSIQELTSHAWESWKKLTDTSVDIAAANGNNSGNLDNLLFLHAVKNIFSLSRVFTDLDFVTEVLFKVLDTDIKYVNAELVQQFNSEYFKIQAIHKTIMSELYRIKLINKYMSVTKMAQTSGPWANMDLPMQERVWKWNSDGEEDYFSSRQESRRQQTRYNPENATKSGFYYVWVDHNRDPYLFSDIKESSPYQSRHELLIP